MNIGLLLLGALAFVVVLVAAWLGIALLAMKR